MRLNDAHCHFFSRHFFEVLARDDPRGRFNDSPAESICTTLEWDPPGTPEALADRWLATLDVQQVTRAALIASVPGDEDSVADAVARDPARLDRLLHGQPAARRCGDRTSSRGWAGSG